MTPIIERRGLESSKYFVETCLKQEIRLFVHLVKYTSPVRSTYNYEQ